MSIYAGRRFRHDKTGGTYSVIEAAEIQAKDNPLTDYEIAIVYRADRDGSLWVRRLSEFFDGRFTELDSPSVEFPAGEKAKAPVTGTPERRLIPVTIGMNDGYYFVAQGMRMSDKLCYGEMLEQVLSLTYATPSKPPRYPMRSPKEAALDKLRRAVREAERDVERENVPNSNDPDFCEVF